jgi:RHS repeat-associated protein
MRNRIIALAIGLTLISIAAATAQEHPNVAKGLKGGGGFGTADIDAVNPFNGVLNIRLPIGQSYPVNAGLSYQLSLVYNSQVWEHETYDGETRAIPTRGANAGLGWSLHLGRLNPPQLELSSSPPPDFFRNTYLAADGSVHTFYPTLHEGESATSGVEYTRDGSYLRLKTASRQVEFPDGAVHTFSSLTNGYLTRIEDRFGNFVQVEYFDCAPTCVAVAPASAHRWRITDTQGRVHWIDLRDTGQSGQPSVVTKVDLQAFGGSRAVYKLLYNDSTDDQSTTGTPVGLTGCRGSAAGSNHSVWFLTRLALPDGSIYDLPKASYFASNIPGDLNNPCKTGLLNRLKLPTLGSVEWDYILYKFSSSSTPRNIWQRSTGVGTRVLRDAALTSIGQWTFTTILSGGTPTHEKLLTNTVTDPLGNRVARYFSVCVGNCTEPTEGPYEYGLPIARDSGGDGTGRFLSAQFFDSGGAPQRTTYSRFEHDTPGTGTTIQEKSRLNQRQASQRTAFNDDPAGTVADEVTWEFDGHGHYRYSQTSGNFPGSNVKSSYRSFNTQVGIYGQPGYAPWPAGSPWVLNVTGFEWDAEGSKCAARSMAIDPTTGWINRARIHRLDNCGESNQDILLETYHDGAGNLSSERYYGGDTQSVATGNIHALPLPQPPQYRIDHVTQFGVRKTSTYINSAGAPLSFKSLDLTIDPSTGLPNANRDSAGKQTTFSYDTLGRLTTIDPTDDLLTISSYCTATSVPTCGSGVRAQAIMARRATVNGTDVTASRLRFDDWGRLINEAQRMPPAGNFESRSFSYNVLGWNTFTSEQGSAFGTSFQLQDAFGRPRRIRPPDGSAHDVTLSYQGVRQISQTVKVATSTTAETSAITTEIYDRFGRLYEVTEPNGTRTRYEYDPKNRLSKVCQGATGAGTTNCGQQRIFTYDQRGFLLSEQHPEKGASGNGFVSYFNYDALGHAGRRIDGPNDLTFTYDQAGRLTLVRETGGGFPGCSPTVVAAGVPRCLKELVYSGANAGANFSKGKLAEARRYNYPIIGTSQFVVIVNDLYTYAGREGRPSQKETRLTFQGTTTENFFQSYVYGELGNIVSLTYPNCAFAACASSPRTLSLGYSQGRLTSIPGVINSITYHPTGMVNSIVRANGVTDNWIADPNGIGRPAEINAFTANWGPSPFGLWTTGSFQYDGSGNVKRMGNASFLYDSLSRVTSGTVYPGPYSNGTAHTQSHTYDAYGNITTVTTNNGTTGFFVNIPTSSTTNRLTGTVSYDNAGNLTSWNGANYEYDAFNQMKRFRSGSEEWLYMYDASDERFWEFKVGANPRYDRFTVRGLDGKPLRVYANPGYTWGNFEDYVYRDGMIAATLASDGTVLHQHPDHLGTPRLLSDATGRADRVQFHSYYPFGEELAGSYSAAYTNRMRFTGHERDLANIAGQGDDLDYMHARHYNLSIGKFLSTDRAGGHPSMPQSWNRYNYARNRSLSLVDPNGYDPIPPDLLRFYNQFFGGDFSNVSLHTDMSGMLERTGNWGVTFGNHIFLTPSAMEQIQAFSEQGITGLGHELTHVLQYQSLGFPRFVNFYVLDTALNLNRLPGGVNAVHDSLLLERVANFAERRMAYTEESVTTCGGRSSEYIECVTTVTKHKNELPKLPPSMLFSGLGVTPQGLPYSLVGSPYDLFFSGAICIERICL